MFPIARGSFCQVFSLWEFDVSRKTPKSQEKPEKGTKKAKKAKKGQKDIVNLA